MQRFVKIFELYRSVHHQWRNEGKEKIQGRRRGGKGEGEREEAKEEARIQVRETQSGLAPPSSTVIHRVEDRIPLRRFNISTKVLIETLSRATILSLYFEGLSDL